MIPAPHFVQADESVPGSRHCAATLYQARVFHRRLRPKAHDLAYSLWALKIDLAHLSDLADQGLLGGSSPILAARRLSAPVMGGFTALGARPNRPQWAC